ncbi:hypothetical protein MXB_5131 [Myxobolus squamalis]|nr:hypothetical protein MXB_5131 [Myxobolus squamalis]
MYCICQKDDSKNECIINTGYNCSTQNPCLNINQNEIITNKSNCECFENANNDICDLNTHFCASNCQKVSYQSICPNRLIAIQILYVTQYPAQIH